MPTSESVIRSTAARLLMEWYRNGATVPRDFDGSLTDFAYKRAREVLDDNGEYPFYVDINSGEYAEDVTEVVITTIAETLSSCTRLLEILDVDQRCNMRRVNEDTRQSLITRVVEWYVGESSDDESPPTDAERISPFMARDEF